MKEFNNEIYEGKIIMFVEGIDLEKDQYLSGTYIENNNIFEKNVLNPGDIVRYKIFKSEKYIDCAEIKTNNRI